MAKYKVIKEISFGSGYYHDKNDNAVLAQTFAPKIGDVIELGEPKEITRPPYVTIKGFTWEFNPVSKLDSFSSQIIPFDAVVKISDAETNSGIQSFLEKHKNHLLILGALALGYLAYKKFKK